MKQVFRFAVCMALCFSLLLTGVGVVPFAADFFKKVDMLHIDSHIEYDVGLNEYATVQGACSDGDYAYFAFMQGGVCNIAKFDAHTWKYVEKEKIVNMGHCNDMTYNPVKDYLVVVNNAPYYDVVTLVDPDKLTPIKDIKLKVDVYSIAYNSRRKTYVVGLSGSYDFALLDSDFKVIKKFKGVNTGYTRQGGDCDDDYIYFVQSGGNNILVVYDYEGNYVTDMPMSSPDEAENMFHIGSEYYVSLYYYGSKLYRIGFSDLSKISYKVSYDPNGGQGEMKATTVTYGKKTKLSKCTYTRPGCFFAGWRVQRTQDGKYIGYRNGSDEYEWLDEDDVFNYYLYEDEQSVAETVKFGNVKMYAVWIAERYDIVMDSGEGEGETRYENVGHDEAFTLSDNGYYKEGYVFDGYKAVREYDNRVYGYRKGSSQPEWLYPSDVETPYHFAADEAVQSLTPEGTVFLTAQYQYAYTFDEDGATLLEYAGVDEKVNIPDNGGELKTLAEGAIKDNEIITDLYIPAGVTSLCRQAVTNCPNLSRVYFADAVPQDFGGESIVSGSAPAAFEVREGYAYFVGFLDGEQTMPLLRSHESALYSDEMCLQENE